MQARCRNDRIRVIIVDDHPVVRSGLKQLLKSCSDIVVVGESADSAGAIDLTEQLSPDMVLLDIRLGDANGLDILPRLRRLAPRVRVIVLTSYDDERYLSKAIRLGAYGFLLKNASDRTIAESIRQVYRGERLVSNELTSKVIEQLERMNRAQACAEAGVMSTEVHLLELISEGATNKEIARLLVISERTAKRRVQQLFLKLGTNSRAQAVSEATKRGII